MKTYTDYQRYINVINRAVEEFGFEPDFEESLNEIYFQAADLIVNGIEGYETIVVGSLGNRNSHLYWCDGMGKEKEVDGEIFGDTNMQRNNTWLRYDESQMAYVEVKDWFDVDIANDYVVCDTDIDSEGRVVLVIATLC